MAIVHVRYPRSQASTPSFCHLQYKKRGEGLEGFIMWCVPLLTSHTVASHDRSSSNQTCMTSWTEWILGKKSEGERTNPDVSRLNVTSAAACITRQIHPGLPPALRTASDKSWTWRPGNEATCMTH